MAASLSSDLHLATAMTHVRSGLETTTRPPQRSTAPRGPRSTSRPPGHDFVGSERRGVVGEQAARCRVGHDYPHAAVVEGKGARHDGCPGFESEIVHRGLFQRSVDGHQVGNTTPSGTELEGTSGHVAGRSGWLTDSRSASRTVRPRVSGQPLSIVLSVRGARGHGHGR